MTPNVNLRIPLAGLVCWLLAFPAASQAPETTILVHGRSAFIDTVNALRLEALHALYGDRPEDLVRFTRTTCVDTASRRRRMVPLLTFEERALVFFRSGNYGALLQDIDSGTHFYHRPALLPGERPATTSRQSSVSLSHGSRELWRVDAHRRLDHISVTVTDTAERRLLSAYWMRALNDLLGFPQDRQFAHEDVKADAKVFLSITQDSLRSAFATRYLLRRRPRSTPSWGIGMSGGGIYPTGPAEKLISGGGLWNVGFQFEFHGLIAGVDLSMCRSKVERPFVLDSTTTTVGELMSFGGVGTHLGYKVLDAGRVRLIPTVGFAQNRFSYDPEDGRQEPRYEESIALRAELIADIKLNVPRADIRSLGNHGWWNGMPEAYPCIRFRAGWQPEGTGSTDLTRAGFYYFSAGIGAFIVSQRRPR